MKKISTIELVNNFRQQRANDPSNTVDLSNNPAFIGFRSSFLQNGNLSVPIDTSGISTDNVDNLTLLNSISNRVSSFNPTGILPLDSLITIKTKGELSTKAITFFRDTFDAESISAFREMTSYGILDQSKESRIAVSAALAKKLFFICLVNGYIIHPELDFNSLEVVTEAIRYIDNQYITASFMGLNADSTSVSDYKTLPSCFTTTQSAVLLDVKPLVLNPISLPTPICISKEGDDDYSKMVINFFKKITPHNRLVLLRTIISLLSTSLIGLHTYNSYRVTNSIPSETGAPAAEALKEEIKTNTKLLVEFIKDILNG